MSDKPSYRAGLVAGGAPLLWERVLLNVLPGLRQLVPNGSRVLEIGYGDGLLSCRLCLDLGWKLVGLEASREAHCTAVRNAKCYGLDDHRVEFRHCAADETRTHRGQYDAVFIKTVLYSSPTLPDYAVWLDWITSVLRPGGVLINFETGRANRLTRFYRWVRRRSYANLCLYTGEVEALYDARFQIIDRRYYGGWSQFLAPLPPLYFPASRIEKAVQPRNADNSFIVSIVAREAVSPGAQLAQSITLSRKEHMEK